MIKVRLSQQNIRKNSYLLNNIYLKHLHLKSPKSTHSDSTIIIQPQTYNGIDADIADDKTLLRTKPPDIYSQIHSMPNIKIAAIEQFKQHLLVKPPSLERQKQIFDNRYGSQFTPSMPYVSHPIINKNNNFCVKNLKKSRTNSDGV